MELDLERDIGDDECFNVDDGETHILHCQIGLNEVICISPIIHNDLCSFDPAVEEGLVYAMCMAGQGDQATLSQWISGLQETCPILGQIPTVFRLESGPRELQTSSDAQQTPEQEVEIDQIIEDEPQRSQRVNQWELFHNAMHFIKISSEIY